MARHKLREMALSTHLVVEHTRGAVCGLTGLDLPLECKPRAICQHRPINHKHSANADQYICVHTYRSSTDQNKSATRPNQRRCAELDLTHRILGDALLVAAGLVRGAAAAFAGEARHRDERELGEVRGRGVGRGVQLRVRVPARALFVSRGLCFGSVGFQEGRTRRRAACPTRSAAAGAAAGPPPAARSPPGARPSRSTRLRGLPLYRWRALAALLGPPTAATTTIMYYHPLQKIWICLRATEKWPAGVVLFATRVY